MTIYKGNKKVVAVQKGGNPISKIYKGNSLVWQKDGIAPSTEPVVLNTINATRSFLARNYVPRTMSFLSTNDGSTEQYFPNTVTIDGEIFNINGSASTFGKLNDGQSITVIFAVDNHKQVGDFRTTLFTASYMGETLGCNIYAENGKVYVEANQYQGGMLQSIGPTVVDEKHFYAISFNAESGSTQLYCSDVANNIITPGFNYGMNQLDFDSHNLNSVIPVPFLMYITLDRSIYDSDLKPLYDEILEKNIGII